MKILERVVRKLTSARFIVALILTITFAILALNGNLSTEFTTIYTAVTVFYFTRDRETTAIEDKKEEE